ncbi:fatty acid desaturase [bacterium]|nr:fatty acid desaturase [bacterium]
MSTQTATADHAVSRDDGKALFAKAAQYTEVRVAASAWQALTSFLPFFALLYAMHWSLSLPYIVTFLLSIVTAGFLIRIFIIQHDCGHGSFFKSQRANNTLGLLCSVLTLMPYYYWRREHALHHAGNGNLDRRGRGDLYVATVGEYLELSKRDRFFYRIYRNPFVLILFGPFAVYLYINRFHIVKGESPAREMRNLYLTNVMIVAMFTGLGFWLGWMTLLKIAAPVMWFAGSAGVWIFYIQHQFEHTYWKPNNEWSYLLAAMQGSSFYRLPKVLQWFTGNIGYHHIHHLKPLIPNYQLQKCHDENPEFQNVYTVTLFSSLQTAFLALWDEQQEKLISFGELKRKYSPA